MEYKIIFCSFLISLFIISTAQSFENQQVSPSLTQIPTHLNEKKGSEQKTESLVQEERDAYNKIIIEKIDNLSLQNAQIIETLQQIERKVRNIENKVGR
jgi:hypothetical protein